jgi:hypothetical protein
MAKQASRREKCGCMGVDHHEAVTNCTSCGRVHCNLEISDDVSITKVSCLFCGATLLKPVPAAAELEECDDATRKAYELRDRLTTYDTEHIKRTKIIDSQSDYYSSTGWLTEEEKEELEKKERARRERLKNIGRARGIKVEVDMFGRVVLKDVKDDGFNTDNDDNDYDEDKDVDDDTDPDEDNSHIRHNFSLFNRSGKAADIYRTIRDQVSSIQMEAVQRKLDKIKNEVK